jgi:MFS family permease
MESNPRGGAGDDRLLSPRFLRVTVANFFFFLNFASFFLLPLHVRALGGSEFTVGLVMGTTGLFALMSVLVVGALLDRLGRRGFLRGGFIVMAVSALGFLWVRQIGPALFALRALQGIGFAAGFNAASTLAAELAPPGRRAAALGVFGVSTLATHALAPTIGEQVVRLGGFPALFVAAAGFASIGLAIAWSVPVPPLHLAAGRARLRVTTELSSAIATNGCCGMAFGSVLTFVPTFVHDAGLGAVSRFFLSYTATSILTRVGAGRLGDSLGRRTVIRPAILLLSLSIALLSRVHSPSGLIGAGLLFGLAQGAVYPTLNAFVVDLVGEGQLGRTQSLYNGAFNLGVTLGSLALGPVAEAFGHRVAFLCVSAMPVLGVAIFSVGTRVPAADVPLPGASGVS